MALPALSVCREFAADNINAVVNHPAVRPWVGSPDAGPLDLTSAVANPANVLLMGKGGGLMFIQLEPGLYEVHTQFVPEHRGAEALQAVKDALRWMFTKSDAIEIVTKVPEGNVPALGLVRAIHGQKLFDRAGIWPFDGKLTGVAHYSLPVMAWAGRSDELAATGQWFHDKLTAAKPDGAVSADDTHARYFGAALEMILSGQVAKAMTFYGRWARFAGYGPLSVIAANPITIDSGDAIFAVRNGDLDILLSR